jgi:hypothetical protein
MAKSAHLAILEQGVDVWNKWREDHPAEVPDLGGVDMDGADLRTARLTAPAGLRVKYSAGASGEQRLIGAKLRGVNFRGANLSHAYLGGADIRGADWAGANLTRTDLTWANLRGADLRRASLCGADLRWADLRSAILAQADVSGAITGSTNFLEVDLSTVRGLDTVNHVGPSTIGIDTIYLFNGSIPEVFLRGAGMPEDFIAYMRSLVGKPIEFYSCFISYSTKDQEFAERLYTDLQAKGVRVWFAPEDLKIGDRFQERIEESIRVYDKLMLVLSTNSVGSGWVEREVQAAFEKEQRPPERTVLFPIRLDDAVMETPKAWAANIRRTRQIGDFTRWKDADSYQKALGRLLRDLKAESTLPGKG